MNKLKNLGKSQPYICIWGKRSAVIENIKKVILYSEESVMLETEYVLKISGKGLKLKYLNNDNVRVDGYIRTIEFDVSVTDKGGAKS